MKPIAIAAVAVPGQTPPSIPQDSAHAGNRLQKKFDDLKQKKDKHKENKALLPNDTRGHLGSVEPGRGIAFWWLSGGTVRNNMAGYRKIYIKSELV